MADGAEGSARKRRGKGRPESAMFDEMRAMAEEVDRCIEAKLHALSSTGNDREGMSEGDAETKYAETLQLLAKMPWYQHLIWFLATGNSYCAFQTIAAWPVDSPLPEPIRELQRAAANRVVAAAHPYLWRPVATQEIEAALLDAFGLLATPGGDSALEDWRAAHRQLKALEIFNDAKAAGRSDADAYRAVEDVPELNVSKYRDGVISRTARRLVRAGEALNRRMVNTLYLVEPMMRAAKRDRR